MSDTPAVNIGAIEDKPLRYCDVCGKLDRAPRHNIGLAQGSTRGTPDAAFLARLEPGPPSAAAVLMDGQQLCRHQDCCAAQGCELCQATEALHAGARDDDLWRSIEAGTVLDLDTDGMKVGGLDG